MVGDMATYRGPSYEEVLASEKKRRTAEREARLWQQQQNEEWLDRIAAARLYQQRIMSPAESDRILAESLSKQRAKGYLTPEGVKVSTVDAQLKQKLQERRDEREVTARLALVDAYGEDVYPVGTVITFDKVYGTIGSGKTYSYAVLKATDGDWYTTGSANNAGRYNWDTLIEFLVSGPKPVKTFIVKAEGGTEVPATAKAYATVSTS